ncbi:hypothetical protein ACTFTM_13155 [Micromonospora sp. RB23]
MEIAACVAGLLVAALLSWLINQLTSFRDRNMFFRMLVVLGVVVLCVASALIIQWQTALGEVDKPVAAITSPVDGAHIDRPQVVDVEVRRGLPKGHTLWLAYQNELGGPVVVQAARCHIIRTSADCGPLYVGHDERDRAAFKVFLVVADTQATAELAGDGSAAQREEGINVLRPALPDGTERVSITRNLVLKD